MSQTEAWKKASHNFEELIWKSTVFSTVLYLVTTKNIKQIRDTFLQGFKTQVSMSTVSQYGLGTWERNLIKKEDQYWLPRKGGI